MGEDAYGRFAELEHHGIVQCLRWIGPATFWMGSPEQGEALLHEVRLTHGYWLADTTCTQKLWQAVMGRNPSHFTEGENDKTSLPVEGVSWDDCQSFLKRLNGSVKGLCARLPTEAEWEHACRAGTTMPFSFGDTITPDQVNHVGADGAMRGRTVPVKSLPANPWGLFEMHGNLWEWCEDDLAPYSPGQAIDPLGVNPEEGLQFRVLRGGSWLDYAGFTRSACRHGLPSGTRSYLLGFRFCSSDREEQERT